MPTNNFSSKNASYCFSTQIHEHFQFKIVLFKCIKQIHPLDQRILTHHRIYALNWLRHAMVGRRVSRMLHQRRDIEIPSPAILLSFSKPSIIGRNPQSWSGKCFNLDSIRVPDMLPSSYIVNDSLVSGVHCKVYAYVLLGSVWSIHQEPKLKQSPITKRGDYHFLSGILFRGLHGPLNDVVVGRV